MRCFDNGKPSEIKFLPSERRLRLFARTSEHIENGERENGKEVARKLESNKRDDKSSTGSEREQYFSGYGEECFHENDWEAASLFVKKHYEQRSV